MASPPPRTTRARVAAGGPEAGRGPRAGRLAAVALLAAGCDAFGDARLPAPGEAGAAGAGGLGVAGAPAAGAGGGPSGDAGAGGAGGGGAAGAPTIHVTAGGAFTCAWVTGGAARCWGSNRAAELGAGPPSEGPNAAPGAVRTGEGAPLSRIGGLVGGGAHACALVEDATARCWGSNDDEQIGGGTTAGVPVVAPVLVLTGAATAFPGVTFVAAGQKHSCMLVAERRPGDPTLFCWGSNVAGQLGRGEPGGPSGPPGAVLTGDGVPLRGATQVALGARHSCARLADATVRCWGANDFGQLGTGEADGGGTAPALVVEPAGGPGPLRDVERVALGGDHACALLAGGSVACWGRNDHGQLGNADAGGAARARPVTVVADAPGATPLGRVEALALGESHGCALVAGGAVHCWGANARGELGRGHSDATDGTFAAPVLTAVATPLAGAQDLAAGGGHSCARLGDGALWCWGANEYGQLGSQIGIGAWSAHPVPVRGLTF